MKFSKRVWLLISGVMWLGIGVMLLMKGLRLLVAAAEQTESTGPLLSSMLSLTGSRQQASLVMICAALLIGFIKGRTVLAKAARRIMAKIESQEGLLTLGQVYDKRYYIILGAMMGLGFILRLFPIPMDIHGVIDVAVGSALVNGSMLYFRQVLIPQKNYL